MAPRAKRAGNESVSCVESGGGSRNYSRAKIEVILKGILTFTTGIPAIFLFCDVVLGPFPLPEGKIDHFTLTTEKLNAYRILFVN